MNTEATRKTLIIGATSAIAHETARLLAGAGDELFLVARDPERLAAVRQDLTVRHGVTVHSAALDVLDFDRHGEVVSEVFRTLGRVDLVLIAHGDLPDQKACEASAEAALRSFSVNALSVVSLLTEVANHMEAQGHGTVAVISSVAGDRGRRSNYVYGSAKGAVSLFLQGLRSRLHPSGIRVVTIKPGFVDTPMTAHIKKGILWASPEKVASGIVRAVTRPRDVVYLPWFWRWIMLVVRVLPEGVFKRLPV
jgi:decaprenylphospho-beta-D-erythro-pentofuranosid-2-ulose 2-reductase